MDPTNQNRIGKKHHRTTRQLIETLESRRLLSLVVVNTTLDQIDANGSGIVSLRDAVAIANTAQTPTTITFDPTVFATSQTITLNGTQLELSNTAAQTVIDGPDAGVTLSGDFQSKIFTVDSGVSADFSLMTWYQGSNPDGFGGALENLGSANLSDVEILSCTAYDGGGIYNYGTLNVQNSAIALNTASIGNGGVGSTGTATLINDTLYGNKSPSGTGGFGEDGTATLDDDTIVDNAGNDFVGGVFTGDGRTTINNTIIAGNTGEAAGVEPDVYGHFYSGGYNLIGATDGSTGWTANDLTGTAASPLAANLGPFQDNGAYTQTLLPQSNSPALSGGSVALIPDTVATDQRLQPRTINGTVDIGAAEVGGTPTLNLASTTSLGASAKVITVGESVLFEATVLGSHGVTPTGTVSIYQEGALQGTYTLNQGQITASITPGQNPLGTDFIAVYSGDNRYVSSSSNTVQLDVKDKSQAYVPPVHGGISGGVHLPGAAIKISDPLKITNPGPTLTGTFTIALDVDPSNVGLDADPANLQTLSRKLTLKTNKSFAVTLSGKKLPATLTPGTYYVVAEITDPTGAIDFVTNPTAFNVQAPVVTLTATATAVKPSTLTVKKSGTIVISIKDTGNIPATGTLVITLLPSSDGVSPSSDVALATLSHRQSINPGKIGRYTLHLKIPASLADGLYDPLVTLSLDGVSASITGSPFTVAAVPVR